MAVYCDECGTPLPAKDRYRVGGGYMCDEHRPDDADDWCFECGQHLHWYQAGGDLASEALQVISRIETHTPAEARAHLDAKTDAELMELGTELQRLAHMAEIAKSEIHIVLVGRQAAALVAKDAATE